MNFKVFKLLVFLTLILSCTKEDPTNSEFPNGVNVNLNRQSVGSSANDLLADANFKKLIIELVYVEGFEPNAQSVNNFISFIENRVHKPEGITVEKRAIVSPGNDVYTTQDIADIEIENRQNYNSDYTIAVWAFFADGKSANDTAQNFILGSAYWNTSFVIFEETLQSLSNGAFEPDRTLLETTVITHEFGHIFGLTNLGSPMVEDHEDNDHPKHCNQENCLMFWTVESSAGLDDMLNMSSAPQLDMQCINDLRANGGK